MSKAKSQRRAERCPRCQFQYAWDGRFCDHCHYPHAKRANWDEFHQLARFPYAHPDPEPHKLHLFGCACIRHACPELPAEAQPILDLLEREPTRASAAKAVHFAENLFTRLPDGPSATRDVVRLLAILAQMLGGPAGSDSPIAYLVEPRTPVLLRPHANELRQMMFQFATQSAQMQAHVLTPKNAAETVEMPEFVGDLFRHHGMNALGMLDHLEATGALRHWRPEQIEEARQYRESRQIANELVARRRMTITTLEAEQCDLYRDIFGYPFVTVAVPLAYRTRTVVELAQSMYETADFHAMPILGDALMDAGCEEGEIIAHCRRPLPHARGCWLIDRILHGDR